MLSTISARTFRNVSFKGVRPLMGLRSKVTLPELAYDYNSLEPHVSGEIMKIHHSKHHQAYVNGLNQAEEKLEAAVKSNDVKQQIALQGALKFNGGGHINHTLFWENLAPVSQGGGQTPKGSLLSAIEKEFGTFDAFVTQFNAAAVGVQGSGWAWLGYNKASKRVEIATTPNQDPLIALTPLLGIDVWEHAYYLQYKNVRPDYMNAIWNIVNWKTVAERFAKAQ
ncbi:Mn superoxide dismutase [Spinellus fusiger]|nr:Mn superoxide dismutase [Spinellus fusiger]